MSNFEAEGCFVSPALIRGLTFDGEKGLFVHSLENQEKQRTQEKQGKHEGKTDLVLPPVTQDDAEATVKAWKTAYDAYVSTSGTYPKIVEVSGTGFYSLGSGYDEAADASSPVSSRVGHLSSVQRADVVRGKIGLVTGGAQGFGEGMVRGLVELGAFVYIADLNLAGAQALSDSLNAAAGRTVSAALPVNVSDEDSVEAMMHEVLARTGGLDVFISNAGVLRAGSVKTMAFRDFTFVTNIDYAGFFLCSKHASRVLAWQNLPSCAYYTDIIAISSKSGLEGSNKNGAYAGAKFGTIGLVQSFALELAADNIKVNAVCPGNFLDGPLWSDPEKGLFVQYLRTGKVPGAKTVDDVRRSYETKVPLGRGCRTDDVMKAIAYIVEQKYETGQAVPVTGGQVMLN
ncbi:SDR family oxidoreductase [Parasphaerochaeta coccoides]|uniref:3-oxoacyl-(Acyl-carrier-protein) reductase n=1 Tax=Parasphaerochaeta coccoides (strain ATCC BAA-1237 / DSM 17374 / SPN1) TaxID=760011 RepID=F4GKG4_PARC1|nr:SDR family NAD(P)-dependent oxidoreductase [Parasphaerochaeta coccoides]AEC02847.1 3-oxoacyl-(acyl-carrier-protein) reductase [Parasphaerochaeta coccoides DSM 17374]